MKQEIAERLAIIRNNAKKNATEFSKTLGLNQPTYNRYETGSRKPPFEVLESIIFQYGINGHWLLTGEGEIYITTKPESDKIFDELISDGSFFVDKNGFVKKRI